MDPAAVNLEETTAENETKSAQGPSKAATKKLSIATHPSGSIAATGTT